MSKVNEILDAVKELTVLELSELVKAFEEEFGVSAAAPVAVALLPLRRRLILTWCWSRLAPARSMSSKSSVKLPVSA